MLYFYTGTDSKKLREKLDIELKKKKDVLRITDAHSMHDLQAALEGAGMFSSGERTLVLDNVLANIEMKELIMQRLPAMKASSDTFYLIASEIDAATRKQVEKYAEKTEKLDVVKGKRPETIFALANALQRGKKKELWVGYQKELASGKSPEAIHGVLFWAAKQHLLKNSRDVRARKLIEKLTELPHEARRAGFDMEYALEHFILSAT